MGLSSIVDAVRTHLTASLPSPPSLIGAVMPARPPDLPAIVASVADATRPVPSVGRVPGPVMDGALRVASTVDLADPTVDFGGETVPLLSADRRTLQIPHGSVVRADGLADLPFTTADLTVRLGSTTFTPVAPPPSSATQVGLDPARGVLTFRNPLPATGTMELGYFVGQWEVRVERFRATLTLQVLAGSAATVGTLSRDVEDAFEPERGAAAAGFRSAEPVAVGTIAAASAPGGAFGRRLDYLVDFERIEPVVVTAGGPIRVIEVTGAPSEPFVVR